MHDQIWGSPFPKILLCPWGSRGGQIHHCTFLTPSGGLQSPDPKTVAQDPHPLHRVTASPQRSGNRKGSSTGTFSFRHLHLTCLGLLLGTRILGPHYSSQGKGKTLTPTPRPAPSLGSKKQPKRELICLQPPLKLSGSHFLPFLPPAS